jgi:hypothetical protein
VSVRPGSLPRALAPIGPRLALLAMILAVVLSARAGVENLFGVVRGIAAFAGTLWLFRLGAGIVDALVMALPAGPPPGQAAETHQAASADRGAPQSRRGSEVIHGCRVRIAVGGIPNRQVGPGAR